MCCTSLQATDIQPFVQILQHLAIHFVSHVATYIHCHDYCIFTVAPVFLSTTDFNEDSINFVRIADPDTHSMFCSHIPSLTTTPVSCKVNGIPIPNITIYREGMDGGKRTYPTTFQQEGEIIVGVPELKPKDFILLHCVAANIVSRVKITINLTYTCK